MTTQIAIYGGGGFAREVAWLVESCSEAGQAGEPPFAVACFVDDDVAAQGQQLNGIPVLSLDEAARRFPRAHMVGGVGDPRLRQRLMEKAAAAGFAFQTVVHSRVERSRWVEIGEGTVICAGVILTTNIRLGAHVQINLDCTVGHDAVLDDYATLAPGVHVSGYVSIGKRVYIGTGATIINGTRGQPLVIGDDAVIGAGACVTRPVPAGVTFIGVPARPMLTDPTLPRSARRNA